VHFRYFLGELRSRGLAYVHVLEGDLTAGAGRSTTVTCARRSPGPTSPTTATTWSAQAALRGGDADLVAFDILLLANPDMVHRYRRNLPLITADHSTFYGGESGYTDYPAYRAAQA